MSVLGKKWQIQNQDLQASTIEKIKHNRSFDSEKELHQLHDPYLFSDMKKAIQRINQAIDDQERIIIFGDYDVDGITSTAILVHALQHLNANVSYRLPHRVHDGYGLSNKFIDQFIEKDVKLVITVDCGISCAAEIAKANQHGIDTIITDHHSIPENPPEAYAIIHPKFCQKYPFKELTGAGVALKLAQALCPDIDHAYFLELACMGTVADLGSLTDENRLIVKKGLQALTYTRRAGLKRLKEVARLKGDQPINSMHIGFNLAPRINAAGRIGDPYKALKLLLEEKCEDTSQKLAQELEQLNQKRRDMTSEAMKQILQMLNPEQPPAIIIEKNPNWHVGILGLIAGRIAEKTNRPAIIMQDFGEHLVASARGPEYFNIIEAIRCFDHLLVNCGGHPQAAGLTIKKEQYQEFKQAITYYAQKKLAGHKPQASIKIDCQIELPELSLDFLNQLSELEPFGVGNQKPTFYLKNAQLQYIDQVGATKSHLKFSVGQFKSIAFNMGQFRNQLSEQQPVDLIFQLNRSYWNGQEKLELQILDFQPQGE